jgi:hypothetical protein
MKKCEHNQITYKEFNCNICPAGGMTHTVAICNCGFFNLNGMNATNKKAWLPETSSNNIKFLVANDRHKNGL